MKASETKKSRLVTRPSRAGGTRRCSSVPQITCGALNSPPSTKPATTIGQSVVATPKTTIGTQATDHSTIITVR